MHTRRTLRRTNCAEHGGGSIVLGQRYSVVDYGILHFALCIRDALELRPSSLDAVCRAGEGVLILDVHSNQWIRDVHGNQ